MFLYPDNFNLPIFNAEDFVQHVANDKADEDGDLRPHTTPLENNVSTSLQQTATTSSVIHQNTSANNVTQSIDLFMETENYESNFQQSAKNVSRNAEYILKEEDEIMENTELIHVSPRENNYSKPLLEEGATKITGMKNYTKYSDAKSSRNKKLNGSSDQLGALKSAPYPDKANHHKTPESNTISLFNKLRFPLVETITEKSTTLAPTKTTTPMRITAEPEKIEESDLQDTRILSTSSSASKPAEVTLNYMSTPKPSTTSGPLQNHSAISHIIDDIFKVGIDMDVSDEAARVMVLMETGMKEAEVEKEKLLPVLQALMDVLEEIERERELEQ